VQDTPQPKFVQREFSLPSWIKTAGRNVQARIAVVDGTPHIFVFRCHGQICPTIVDLALSGLMFSTAFELGREIGSANSEEGAP
jgi:hypothetical protein